MPFRECEVKPALVLDLDGTVRFSKSGEFISGPEDVGIFEDVAPVLKKYERKGYYIIGVTNQGGVAFGHKTADQEREERWEVNELLPMFEYIYAAHSMPGGKPPLHMRSLFRKPAHGLLARAEYDAMKWGWLIDWDNSIVVGDSEDDRMLAASAGTMFRWADDFFGRNNPSAVAKEEA